jgi:hypothetical protein
MAANNTALETPVLTSFITTHVTRPCHMAVSAMQLAVPHILINVLQPVHLGSKELTSKFTLKLA